MQETAPVLAAEAPDVLVRPTGVGEGFGQKAELAGVIETDGQALGAEAAVHVRAQSYPAAMTHQLGDAREVSDAVADRGPSVGHQEHAEQVQADDAVASGDGQDLVVTQVTLVFTGDYAAVGMRGHDRSAGSGHDRFERLVGEV